MDRRNFLKSIGASALLPAIPVPSFAIPAAIPATIPAAVPAFSSHTYQWAEMIVRAHNKCNLGLLQRSLHVNGSVAEALKSSLIKNGVVQSQANAYGIHKATKPLYENAFMKVSDTAEKIMDTVSDHFERDEPPEASGDEVDHEIETVPNDLPEESGSSPEDEIAVKTSSESAEEIVEPGA